MCILLSERSQSEKATYYIAPTLRDSGETVKPSVKKEGGAGGALRIFRAVKLFLYDTITVDT